MPDGVGAARTYGIAGGLSASEFGVGTPETRVLVAELLPDGATFAPPGVTIAFRWSDDDDDGAVDGTAIGEHTLRVYHDGLPITPTCVVLAAAGCTDPPCCLPAQNVFTVQVTSFSEFVVVSEPAPETSSTTHPPSTSTTAPSSTSTTAPPTTTTLPACATVRCLLDEARNGPACAGTLPPAVARKLDGAVSRVELAPTATPRKAPRLYKAAKRLLAKAATAAGKASRGRRPRLSAECATTLRQAIGIATGRVGT